MKVNIGKYRRTSSANRHIKVTIDDWDTWSLDHTLALIIHPALIAFKEHMHGYPADLITNNDDSDAGFEAWKIIIDKMIFAFTNIIDTTWEEQFYSDEIGYKEYDARIQEGLDLFSKYFRSLWD